MKLAIFSKIGNDVSVPDLCALLAQHGYHGVEWRLHEEGHVRPSRIIEDARKADAAAREHNLESICLSGYLKTFDVDVMESQLATAAAIGCPNVRIWPPAYRGTVPYPQLFDTPRRELDCIAAMARRHGVRAVFEIHYGNIAPSVGLMSRLLQDHDPREVGVIYDPDNFTKEGQESWQMGLELIWPYLAYVQFKNSAWVPGPDPNSPVAAQRWSRVNADLEEGLVDWTVFFRVLHRLGYDGYLSNEDGRPVPLSQKLVEDHEIVTRLWQAAAKSAESTAKPELVGSARG